MQLGGGRKVEAACDNGACVNDHDLAVRDGVLVVDIGRDAVVGNEIGFGVLLGSLAFVEDDGDFDPTLVGADQGRGDGLAGEAVSSRTHASVHPPWGEK